MCLHWRWNPRQSPGRRCGQPWAALLGTTRSSAVAGHACWLSLVFQEFGHILSHSHLEKELPVLQTKMHLYPCKIRGTFNTKIIIPLGIVYCNGKAGSQEDCGLSDSWCPLPPWVTSSKAYCMQYCLRSFCPNFPTTLTSWPFLPVGGNKILEERTNAQRPVFRDSGRRTVLCVCLLRGSDCGQLSTRKRKSVSHSVMSDSLQPYGLLPTGLLCP